MKNKGTNRLWRTQVPSCQHGGQWRCIKIDMEGLIHPTDPIKQELIFLIRVDCECSPSLSQSNYFLVPLLKDRSSSGSAFHT